MTIETATRAWRTTAAATTAAIAVMLATPAGALACSVCYGDPEAPQNKAMVAGVLVLLGFIGTVLAGFAGMFCYWMLRSRRLTLANEGVTH